LQWNAIPPPFQKDLLPSKQVKNHYGTYIFLGIEIIFISLISYIYKEKDVIKHDHGTKRNVQSHFFYFHGLFSHPLHDHSVNMVFKRKTS